MQDLPSMRYASLLLLMLLPWPVAAQGGLAVVDVAPPANAVSAERDTAIVIDFNAAVDPATFDAASVAVFGRWSGVMPGEVVFEAGNTRARFVPQRPFSAGEMVTVSLARRLATPDGQTMDRGYAWQFWTRPRRASLFLEETGRLPVRRPGEGHVQTYGAYAGDLDGDGYTDFAVPNEKANDVRVFMNDGGGGFGGFTAYPIPQGALPSTNEGADFNRDGHLDLAVGNSQGDLVSVFLGDGTGHLDPPANYTTAQGVRGLAVLDLDGDGFPDIATASRDDGVVAVLHNDGDGTFTRTLLTNTPGLGETAAAAADANEDGVLDLFVGAFESREILVLLGDGDGGLTFHTRVDAGGTSWMIATGDVNGDGHVDVVSANARSNNASVLLGDGHGHLVGPAVYATGGFPLAIELGDLDGDGDLDLVTSNFNGNDWTILENRGGLFGNARSLRASRAGSCAVLHDRDNNGTLDVTGIDELDDLLFLFTNAPVATAAETPPPLAPFALRPPYPNPFTGRTTLTFHLDAPTPVRLAVYDLLGRSVRTLLDERRGAGTHTATWDGRDDAGRPLPAGPYFYRLEAHGAAQIQPLLYVR